ncbi:immunoglobulin-like domain-containing protein [Thermococcus profundus]|nr:immunoglobulin-like domain-containing protein [Thermococcus profundus]
MKRVVLVMLLLFGMVFAYQVLITQEEGTLKEVDLRKDTIDLNETLGPMVPVENISHIIRLDRQTYSPGDTMTLTVTNSMNSTLTTRYDFRIYRRGNEGWIEVQLNLAFPDVLIEVRPGESWEERIDLSELGLKPGKYRVEKTICANGLCFPDWAEFEVKG